MTSSQVFFATKLRSGSLLTSLRARATGCGCFLSPAFSNIGYAEKSKYARPKVKSHSSTGSRLKSKTKYFNISSDFRWNYYRSLHKSSLGIIGEYISKNTGTCRTGDSVGGEHFIDLKDKVKLKDPILAWAKHVGEQLDEICQSQCEKVKWKIENISRSLLSLLNQIQGQRVSFFSSGKQTSNHEGGKHGEQHEEKQRPPGDDDPYQISWQLTILLAIGGYLYLRENFRGKNIEHFAPETSYPVFYSEMLSVGEVERLEVSSTRDRVYVYLRPGAIVNITENPPSKPPSNILERRHESLRIKREEHQLSGPGPHYTFTISSAENLEEKLNKAQKEFGINSSDYIPVTYRQKKPKINGATIAITTLLLLPILFSLMGKGGGSFNLGRGPFGGFIKARTTIIEPGIKRGIGFKDVAGMEEAKVEIMEFVEYLQDPSRFTDLGAKMPKGALMIGPPGTGKTLLAKAVATEADVPFITMAGSDFVEMFGGVAAARVRDLFAQARKRAPCIVYIDEFDAIGRSRSSTNDHNEQEHALNQLLVEMDGINTVEGVVMLASTNRADILDQALLRPGRFDRLISIDLPTLIERREIFEIYLKKLKLKKPLGTYSKRLAELTPGKSGADIANICNEAALHAARLNEGIIQQKNFEYAVERVIAGMERRSRSLSPAERQVVAYHEAGHAILGWMLKHTEPILKISIVPRTNSVLGYTLKLPVDNKLFTNEQLFDAMCMMLGGRVAEELIFKRITTGAQDDLHQVTQSAYKQIATFGMNNRVGLVSYELKKRGDIAKKPYSDKTAKLIDEEASKLVQKAYDETKNQLNLNRDKLEKLAEALLEKEVLNYDDLRELLGESPYGDKRQLLKDESLFGDNRPLENPSLVT